MSNISTSEKWKMLFHDFQNILLILRGQLIILFFILLTMFLFLGTDQGLDVSFCIVEDLAAHSLMQVATTLMLFLAVFFWSISTNFCSRFTIYITDNSGHSLSPEQIKRRTVLQKATSNILGLCPIVIAFLTFVRVGIKNIFTSVSFGANIWLIIALLFILAGVSLLGILYRWLYYKGGVAIFAIRFKWFHWLLISSQEQEWVSKLYGIFSDLRFQMTKATADANEIDVRCALPAGRILPDGRILPIDNVTGDSIFRLCPGYPRQETNTDLFIWMYQAPLSFYAKLRRQFWILVLLATVTILFFSLLAERSVYANVGAVALVLIATGCWQAIYMAAHYADKVKYRWAVPIPIRSILFLLFFITTFLNHDHPVRKINVTQIKDTRMQLSDHFKKWVAELREKDTVRVDNGRIPVVFVTAEGGALRTGGFTTMLLARTASIYPRFNDHIYAYSSVSGGSIGCNVYYALTKLKASDPGLANDSLHQMALKFYQKDYLAPVIGKFAFGEIINYYLPFHVQSFDRAIALEKAWEDEFSDIASNKNDSFNYLGQEYFSTAASTGGPVFLTNTVEVETGRQCVWSNVNIQCLPMGNQRDLFARYLFNIPYSTATNLSSRFPLVSPGAAFYPGDSPVKHGYTASHYIDGGYYENKGSETMLQVLQELKKTCSSEMNNIHPYVIQINFGMDDDSSKPIRAFSEITEIIAGIYHTRSARGELQQSYLKTEVDSLHGTFIAVHIPSNGKIIPNDWVLSYRAADSISVITDNIVRLRDIKASANWKDLFIYK